jgi:hypothetical protein
MIERHSEPGLGRGRGGFEGFQAVDLVNKARTRDRRPQGTHPGDQVLHTRIVEGGGAIRRRRRQVILGPFHT